VNDLVGIPTEVIICPYSLVFRATEAREIGIKRIDIAKFVDISFNVIDDETGEEFCSEPITHSLN
jgi:hypothetical protein